MTFIFLLPNTGTEFKLSLNITIMNKLAIIGLARHLLTFGGGYLVSKGIIDEGSIQEVVGSIITVGGLILSIFAPEKKRK